jgi:hypothetical protein
MPRTCQVTLQDLDGIRHIVGVEADSVYEACVYALIALRKAGFVDLQPGNASTLSARADHHPSGHGRPGAALAGSRLEQSERRS